MSAKRKKSPSEDQAKKPPRKPPSPRPDEMTPDVLEFITAIDDYKRHKSRPFPNWSEILDILKELGYERSPSE